jgi:hypothetical protein
MATGWGPSCCASNVESSRAKVLCAFVAGYTTDPRNSQKNRMLRLQSLRNERGAFCSESTKRWRLSGVVLGFGTEPSFETRLCRKISDRYEVEWPETNTMGIERLRAQSQADAIRYDGNLMTQCNRGYGGESRSSNGARSTQGLGLSQNRL